jgi:hypothetical protein
MEEVTEGWIKLHEELRNLFWSPDIIMVIKLSRVRWAGHIESIGKKENAYKD